MSNFKVYIDKYVLIKSISFHGIHDVFVERDNVSPSGNYVNFSEKSWYKAIGSKDKGWIPSESVEVIEVFDDE